MKKTVLLFLFILPVCSLFADMSSWNYRGASITGSYNTSLNSIHVYKTVDYLKSLGINSIALIVNWYQDDFTSTTIYKAPDKTINDDDLVQVINYCHDRGLKVNLKPHLDIYPKNNDYTDWRALINPSDTALWFAEYEKFLLHYLKIAQNCNVDIFTIGTEMVSMTRPGFLQNWKTIVTNIKKTGYQGLVTYCADQSETFGEKTLKKDFWELFDIISISTYYPSSLTAPQPAYQSLAGEWLRMKDKMESWKRLIGINKKVIVAETGFRSIDYTHTAPYKSFGPVIANNTNYNDQLQADCYKAMINAFNKISWLDGFFIWAETMETPPEYFISNNTGYSIINKAASQVFKDFFGGRGSYTTLRINPLIPTGNWYYYADDSGKSKIIVDNTETLDFKFKIKQIAGQMEQVSPISGTVSNNHSSPFIGSGINLSKEDRQKIKNSRGIRFSIVSNTRQFLFLVESGSENTYTCYKSLVSVTPGKVTNIDILFKDLLPYDKWTGPFKLENVGDISFRTAGAPLNNVSIEIYRVEFINQDHLP